VRRGRFRHTLRAVLGLTLTFALLAAPAPAPAQTKPEDVTLAAPPFDAAQKMPKKDMPYYSEHFAQRLTTHGIQVITTQQITTVREMEKLRQLAGCPATSADCIIELGHMLGAQGVVRGTIAKVGELYQVDVRVYQSSDGKVIAARSASARSSESLIRALDQVAVETAGLVKAAFAPPKPVEEVKPPPPPPLLAPAPIAAPPPPKPIDLRGLAWLPGALGVAAGAGSGIFFGLAQGKRTELEGGELVYDSAVTARATGETYARAGTGLAIGAGAALALGGAMYLFGAPRSSVSVTPAPSGAKLEVRFP